MKKIFDGASEITLNDFLNMWFYRDHPVAIVDYDLFDRFADEGVSFHDFKRDAEVIFSLASAHSYKARGFLKDWYAYARVKAFMFMDSWCVIGIEGYEPEKEET